MLLSFSPIMVTSFITLEKLQRFESLLLKCKEKIRTQKEQIGKLEADHETAVKSLGDKEEEIRQLHVILHAFVTYNFKIQLTEQYPPSCYQKKN